MKIPNFVNERFVDEKGYLTDTWRLILTKLFTELQNNASDEGLIAPNQSAAIIAQLNLARYKGAFLYNTDTNKAIVNINGTFKDVLTT